jgi:hypothetical protein
LYLERQQQGIEVLSELKGREDLTLRSITTEGLDYISTLPRLWSLDIKLGGIRNLSAIAGKESIKYLGLWQIRGLSDMEGDFLAWWTVISFSSVIDKRDGDS